MQRHICPVNDVVEHSYHEECVCQPKAHTLCMECDGEGCTFCDYGIREVEGVYIDPVDDTIWVHFKVESGARGWPIPKDLYSGEVVKGSEMFPSGDGSCDMGYESLIDDGE